MTLAKLTPQQAATRAQVSRGTIMNAIKDGSLPAMRDNRNRWQIHPDKLAGWLASRGGNDSDNSTVKAAKPDGLEPPATLEKDIRLAVLEADLKAKDQRISDMETERQREREAINREREAFDREREAIKGERDSWKEQAQQLALRRRWWPF